LIGPPSQRFRARYPNITLSIRVAAQEEEIEPALIDDELDLGIGFGNAGASSKPPANHSGLESFFLLRGNPVYEFSA
jgi:DNA-binding transcriptional LysR family regulator